MANAPLLNGRVNITVRDINNNNIAKQFSSVINFNFDYVRAIVNIVDSVQGSFQFSLSTITTLTYTIVPNPGGSHSVTMS